MHCTSIITDHQSNREEEYEGSLLGKTEKRSIQTTPCENKRTFQISNDFKMFQCLKKSRTPKIHSLWAPPDLDSDMPPSCLSHWEKPTKKPTQKRVCRSVLLVCLLQKRTPHATHDLQRVCEELPILDMNYFLSKILSKNFSQTCVSWLSVLSHSI